MALSLAELEALVRRRICGACDVRTVQGACDSQEPERCKLFELFPLVAQAILATDSDDIGDYVGAIRENVCSVCMEQALDGSCRLRGQVQCALDTHLGAVVDAIEEATGKSFDRRNLIA
ncbi:MAG: hypothetical protein AAB225_25005 [Acidobacteriota bacterium]